MFPSNRGFVFHDSRGFESGAVDELDKVQEFIRKRGTNRELNERLHTIWFENLLSSFGIIDAVTYVCTGTVFPPTVTDSKPIWNFSIKSIQVVVGGYLAIIPTCS